MRTPSSIDRRAYLEMLAKGFREAGVLLAVFGPIACEYEGHELGGVLHSHVIGFILLGLALFGIGAILEAGKWSQWIASEESPQKPK